MIWGAQWIFDWTYLHLLLGKDRSNLQTHFVPKITQFYDSCILAKLILQYFGPKFRNIVARKMPKTPKNTDGAF